MHNDTVTSEYFAVIINAGQRVNAVGLRE